MATNRSRRFKETFNFLGSIRFRLALWFVLVLGLVLGIFSLVVYYRETQAVRTQAEARLASRLRSIEDLLRASFRQRPGEDWSVIPGTAGSSQFMMEDWDVMVLAGTSRQIVRAWGPLSDQQTIEIAGVALGSAQEGLFEYLLSSPSEAASAAVQPYLFASGQIALEERPLGWLILGQPVDPEGRLERLRWTLGVSVLVTLLAALGGSYWLADRALRPVQAITRTAREIGASDLSRRLNLRSTDELGQLAATFDQMLERLQAAFARQRQFTADASHELRTPLTIIELEASQALESNRSPEEHRRAVQVIQSENEFMSRLVKELLTLARMDAGQVQLNLETVDLSDVALEVVERYAPLAARKDIRVETGDLPELLICADRQFLLQMAGNLVENAIKYSPEEPGRWVRVETGQRPAEGGAAAWLRVSDNGPGIPAEHIPHLFDRFYRVDAARSHNPQPGARGEDLSGSGLGLSIVRWIAEAHGGKVRVESEPGQGSIFTVELPSAL